MTQPATSYDSQWKETLDNFCPDAMELLFPLVHTHVDWQRGFEFLDAELAKITGEAVTPKGIVDKLIKVWLKTGEEAWLLLHVEVQSQTESDFPLRMFTYNIAIFLRYNREVVSLAILGDDRPAWRPSEYRWERWGCEHVFRFPVAKLLDWRPRLDELRQSRNPAAHMVLAHLRAQETTRAMDQRYQYKKQVYLNLYELGYDGATILRLYRLMDWLMTLPEDLQTRFRDDVVQFEKEKHMPYVTSIERLARDEGRSEARRDLLHDVIKSWLEKNFGEAARSLHDEAEKIDDVDKLQKIYEALKTDASLEKIRKLIRKPQTKTRGR